MQLVSHLERYSQEDERVRILIDRRARVVRARDRIEDAAGLMNRSGKEGAIRKSSKLVF